MRDWGDRADGKRVRKTAALVKIIPFISQKRTEAPCYLQVQTPYEEVGKFLKKLKAQGHNISLAEVLMCAMVRTISLHPQLNRFIHENKLYAREGIQLTLISKRGKMSKIPMAKLSFERRSTLYDVGRITDRKWERCEKNLDDGDLALKSFSILPAFIKRRIIGFFRFLDNRTILPGKIIRLSPFHTSAFFTDLASLNLLPQYGNLCDDGTASLNIVFGIKKSKNGKLISCRITADSRICSADYLSKAVATIEKLLLNPETLEIRPKITPSIR